MRNFINFICQRIEDMRQSKHNREMQIPFYKQEGEIRINEPNKDNYRIIEIPQKNKSLKQYLNDERNANRNSKSRL